jgi:hypothetical protein
MSQQQFEPGKYIFDRRFADESPELIPNKVSVTFDRREPWNTGELLAFVTFESISAHSLKDSTSPD